MDDIIPIFPRKNNKVKVLKFRTLYSILFWPKFCFLCSCFLKYLLELCRPCSDCSFSLIWVCTVCISYFVRHFGVRNFIILFCRSKEEKKEKKTKQNKVEAEDESPKPSTSSQATEAENRKKKKRNKYKIQHGEVSSTTVDPISGLMSHIKSYQPRKYLLVKAGGEAFDNQVGVVEVWSFLILVMYMMYPNRNGLVTNGLAQTQGLVV